MPGWRDEAEAEDIDGHAQHVVNNEGRREYQFAYARAKAMNEEGKQEEEIRRVVIQEPEQPKPNQDGQVTMIWRKNYAAAKRLSDVRKRAVEDALHGKPPSYKD
jgi:hypothetical protein